MPRVAGVYSLPSGNPIPYGSKSQSALYNAALSDLATVLSNSLDIGGSNAMQAVLNMGGFKISNIGVPSVNGDVLSWGNPASVTTLTATGAATLQSTLGITGATNGAGATWTGADTAARFIPTGATVPANGMYLPAANTLGFATNSTEIMALTTAGAAIFGSSGSNQLTVGTPLHSTIFNVISNDGGLAAAWFVDASTTLGLYGTAVNIPFALMINNSEAARFTTNKNFLVGGTADVGVGYIGQFKTAAANQSLILDVRNSGTTGASQLSGLQLVTVTANSYIQFFMNDNGGSNPNASLSMGSGVSNFFLNSPNYIFRSQNGATTFASLNASALVSNVPIEMIGINTSAYPFSTTQAASTLAFTGNFSGGNGEVNVWNSFWTAAEAFRFSQQTGATARTDLLSIRSNGNVLMGTLTDGGERLQVVGATATNQLAIGTPAHPLALFFGANDSSSAALVFGDANTTIGYLGSSAAVPIGFLTGNAERARFDHANGGVLKLIVGGYTLTSTVAAAATTTINCQVSNKFRVTMGANITTLTVSNPSDGQPLTINFKQDGTGNRTIAWPAAFHWVGGAPTLSTAAGSLDTLTAQFDVTDGWTANLLKGVA